MTAQIILYKIKVKEKKNQADTFFWRWKQISSGFVGGGSFLQAILLQLNTPEVRISGDCAKIQFIVEIAVLI